MHRNSKRPRLQYCPNQLPMQQNTKWTQEEDERLKAAVRKHGTQWGSVSKQINYSRSQNAIIKRWHGYLRKNFQQFPSKSQPVQEKNQQKLRIESKAKVSDDEQSSQMIDENEQRGKTERENVEMVKKIEEEPYQFKLNWAEQEDIKLKNLIVNEGILYWDKLAAIFNTTEQQVKTRWIKCLCPKLKNTVKIGGALKWSVNEDYILYAADRNKVSHADLLFFLTCRTVYSIEARWRRICKNTDIINHLTVVNNRSSLRREALKKIALKRCLQKKEAMNKIYEKEKEAMEKQKIEQEKFELMRRQDKMRKVERS